jgi:putative hemolysin
MIPEITKEILANLAALVLMLISSILLCLTTTIQNLYLESLRLRTRELPALSYFKDQVEDRIGLPTERGALIFSLWKHSLLALLGILTVAVTVKKGDFWESVVEAAVASWAIMMVVAYVVPQMLYRKTSGKWLSPLVPFIKLLVLLVTPLAALLGFLQSLAELNDPEPDPEEANSASDDIEALIEAGAEGGLIEQGDKKLIQSVVEFGDKIVRDVMTPRPSIVAIQEDKPIEEFRQLVANERYSRIPVFRKNIDDIVGFVHVHDLIAAPEDESKRKTVKDVARPIKQVPETKPVKQLMDDMRADGTHMSVVIDEYGNTAGLATMEDLVEEILGEIRDEHEPHQDAKDEGDGCFVMAGSYDLDHLKDLLGYERSEEMEATTVGGLATEWFGRVPQKGEVIEREGIRLEILDGHDLRVEKVRASRLAVPQAVTANGDEAHA